MIAPILRAVKLGGGVFPTLRLIVRVLRDEGWKGVIWRFNVARRMYYIDSFDVNSRARIVDYNQGYGKWREINEPAGALSIEEGPLISVILPVYRPNLAFLRSAINSVLRQSYKNWELCVVDDGSVQTALTAYLKCIVAQDERIRLQIRDKNGHICKASNEALSMATGEFVALLDHDDELHPNALAYVAEAIKNRSDAEVIYSDEDKMNVRGKRHHPNFKPEFNPVLLLAQNMISHLGVYRTSTMLEIGGFREGVEGAQDWDLAWRVIELKGADKVVHIPRVLYHWRELEGSTSRHIGEKSYAAAAQLTVIRDHLSRIKREGVVTSSVRVPGMVRVQFAIPKPEPLVSIVVPTRDRNNLLQLCIRSLFAKTSYPQYELIVVDNDTQESGALDYLDELRQVPGVSVIRAEIPFNYSRLNNLAVAQARGDYILLLNNDIELTHDDWLTEMMSWAVQPEVGCVGAKLWYPNGTLQHGGVILGVNGLAGHAHRGVSKIDNGYVARAAVHQNLSAVTAACLLVKRSIYEQMKGLDERFSVAYNDIDFCLRVQAAGYRNVWTPYAEMIHHESATRGVDSTGAGRIRLEAEIALMRERWGHIISDDPAYSPNLTRTDEGFSINLH